MKSLKKAETGQNFSRYIRFKSSAKCAIKVKIKNSKKNLSLLFFRPSLTDIKLDNQWKKAA
jgi:hypothetical protein